MAKATTSFRLSDDAKDKLDVLSRLFKETQTEVLEKAIKIVFDDRERLAKEDMDQRLKETKSATNNK